MDFLNDLLQGQNGDMVRQLTEKFGIDEGQAGSAITALVSALQGGSDHAGAVEQAAGATGLDAGLLGQLAPLVSGLLSGQGGGGLLGMLDANKDGSVVDDVMGMAQKFLDKG
jgi:hypothetical protein